MGTGKLSVQARTANETLPVYGAVADIYDLDGKLLSKMITDRNGSTEQISIEAPDKSFTLDPNDRNPHYTLVSVTVSAPGYITEIIKNVHVYDTIESVVKITMLPLPESDYDTGRTQTIEVPPPAVESSQPRNQQEPMSNPASNPMSIPTSNPTSDMSANPVSNPPQGLSREVIIPDYITVHLGTPNAAAQNVRLPFPEYIKNVASSEIYPTWPRASLEANIYSIITFALNRVYTEWYRSRGFAFDITNSTAFDMAFVPNREIFNSISVIVDRIFNEYARRAGRREPFFTSFCNGTTATCDGLSQWGTVPLANQGMTPLQILRYYFPNDLELVTSDNIQGITVSYPGTPLTEGNQSEHVRLMQRYLNRIRADYPLIPQIISPNGFFGADTTAAVRTFQSVFNLAQDGVIGKSTWNKIWFLYIAVTRLAELDSEGEFISIGLNPPTSVLRRGARGSDVAQLQFLLNFTGQFYPTVPVVIQDSFFGPSTETSVKAFQSQFGLTADGIVGPATWNKLYEVYRSIKNTAPIPPAPPATTPPFPGVLLRLGSTGEYVRTLQRFLNLVADAYPQIPRLVEDGIFGQRTENSVRIFQGMFGLTADGAYVLI